MRKNLFTLILIAFTFSSFAQPAQIVITEIMYNPVQIMGDPGGGVEYMEIYNHDAVPVNLNGYTFDGIDFTFGNVTLAVGATLLLSNDSVAFQARYGMMARQYGGFIQNAGETILIMDNLGQTVDSVPYQNDSPWPATPNGFGTSMNLCSPFADNANPAFWQRSNNFLGFLLDGIEIFGTPGTLENCYTGGPIISFVSTEAEFYESGGTVEVFFSIDNVNTSSTGFFVTVTAMTASLPADANATNQNLTFFGNSTDLLGMQFDIIDDTLLETPEQFLIVITGTPSNNALVATDSMVVTILDNDGPVDKSLILTGVWDAASGFGGTGLGFELYTRVAIPDLSIFGYGSANNGNGSAGIEGTFPAVPWPANSYIYVADDSARFHDFFGFAADFIFDLSGFNGYSGDDAIEIFETGTVIDIFGLIDVDGTGEIWEYTNGWVYRKDTTGPDCDVFDPANWTYGGLNILNGVANNAAANPPYPIGTYQYTINLTPADAAMNIVAADIANSGNASDMEISFNKAADESTVGEYRIIVLKTADAAGFTKSAANAVTDYASVSPTGSNIVEVLAANQRDKDGDPIIINVAYKAFVLSIADGVNAAVNTLSGESNELTLDNSTAIEGLESLSGIPFIYNHLNTIYIKSDKHHFDISVFNALGEEIVSLTALSGDQVIELNDVAKGIYFVKYNLEQQEFTKKVFVD